MATFIDGIAASENIDSSGERISIQGMDITSLPVDGVFNYEHESKHPDQVVGKVLLAKKIFSEKDCDDERQLYFWNKCQIAYVYVMGELFDDYKESAREVAGMFKYDNDKRDQNERNVMNFSIEGAKISKDGINVTKSIARKVTITVLPCNKAAVAEMVPAKGKKQKDDLDNLFKTETVVEIELFKSEDMGAFLDNLKKSANLKLAPPAADHRGTHMGTTSGGHKIFSHERIGNYQGMSSKHHKEAMNMHYTASTRATDPKIAQHHTNKMKLHMSAMGSAEKRESRISPNAGAMKKAMTASSVTAKECIDPKMHKGCTHDHTPLAKNEQWLERAVQEYANWPKKDQFVKFMSETKPSLTKTEIDVMGQTLALKDAVEAEAALAKLARKK